LNALRGLLSRPLEAVLFDFDGTLVDSVPDLAVSVDATLAHFGAQPVGEAQVRDWVGRGAWQLIRQACDGVITDPDRVEQAYGHFLQHYAEQCAHNPCLYPGVAEGLAEIQSQVPTALVTNKPMSFTKTMLDALGLEFSVVLGGDSVAVKKPDPSMLLTACSTMQVDPAGCVMIGDSSNDSEAARAAGMPVALFSGGYNHGNAVELAAPDLIYHQFNELLQ